MKFAKTQKLAATFLPLVVFLFVATTVVIGSDDFSFEDDRKDGPRAQAAIAFAQEAQAHPREAFDEWKALYGKSYPNHEALAFEAWRRTVDHVVWANANPAYRHWEEVNELADWSYHERLLRLRRRQLLQGPLGEQQQAGGCGGGGLGGGARGGRTAARASTPSALAHLVPPRPVVAPNGAEGAEAAASTSVVPTLIDAGSNDRRHLMAAKAAVGRQLQDTSSTSATASDSSAQAAAGGDYPFGGRRQLSVGSIEVKEEPCSPYPGDITSVYSSSYYEPESVPPPMRRRRVTGGAAEDAVPPTAAKGAVSAAAEGSSSSAAGGGLGGAASAATVGDAAGPALFGAGGDGDEEEEDLELELVFEDDIDEEEEEEEEHDEDNDEPESDAELAAAEPRAATTAAADDSSSDATSSGDQTPTAAAPAAAATRAAKAKKPKKSPKPPKPPKKPKKAPPMTAYLGGRNDAPPMAAVNLALSSDPLFVLPGSKDPPPSSMDWRTMNVLQPVKHQGICGTCWAFTAVAAIEAAVALANPGGDYVRTNLSTQQAVDCTNWNGQVFGCNLGSWGALAVLRASEREEQLATEEDYPYVCHDCSTAPITNTTKPYAYPCQTHVRSHVPAGTIRGYVWVNKSEDDLLKAVARQPVGVSMSATAVLDNGTEYRFLATVGGGIMDDAMCKECNERGKTNHEVLIVGYGTDPFDNTDYWIAQNSWGPRVHSKGFFRMKRGINCCLIVNRNPWYPVAQDPPPTPTPDNCLRPCGNDCCAEGYICVDGFCAAPCGTSGVFCPAGKHCYYDGQCCDDTSHPCSGVPGGCYYAQACPSCCGAACCAYAQGTCCGDTCCDPVSEECCGGHCCKKGQNCCNGQCCDGQCCGDHCCPPGKYCCGNGFCCDTPCCGDGQYCCKPGSICSAEGHCCPPDHPHYCSTSGRCFSTPDCMCCGDDCCYEDETRGCHMVLGGGAAYCEPAGRGLVKSPWGERG
ncbi:hypothetical protein HYH03_004552 [Edaphochlamys debaryana]|uniref:Peptidase C1A papain C-terminal domain-containing protein n=1 Tax=Edaphochlamys debaryana TaxID=47281 RepID=A0A836C319_9CHLO|nr:hypothetical protein HYH03_004552 [Edaphochlamys debaryana]|eukprot:KAG2497397.1 hypothetical protein HYH03_004552 [Edaphochlamys debaryana]